MTEQEIALYRKIRNVPADKSLAAAKAAMHARSEQRFKAEVAARAESMARVEPAHNAMREALKKMGLQQPSAKARVWPQRTHLPALKVPPAPKVHRLKMGSVHMVDTPPFQAQTWQGCSFSGGNESVSDDVVGLSADGNTGNMSFNIWGGGIRADNASSVSCWAAVGQAYTMPSGLGKEETDGAFLRFSANPSFNWQAIWGSDWWRLASGNIWIGQVVNRFDADWSFIDDPIWTQNSLISWNDYNFADAPTESGETSGFGLTSWLFVQPNFNYFAWVWIGASVFGDTVDSGWSLSTAIMNANCSQLILDTF